MTALLTILHVIICLVLVMAVLLQSGKSADLAGAFGGGGSATAFGPRGSASLMSKVTTISAILFMVTSLGLWVLSGHESKSALSGVQAPAPIAKTATPPVTTPPVKTDVKKDDSTAAAAAAKPGDKAAAPLTKPSTAQPENKPAAKK